MKRVALLAYYFPPLGGAGVQRAVTLARRLPALGWEPVVVTGPAAGGDRWSPHDAGLGAGLERLEVIRVAGPEPPRGEGRAERWLRIRSDWARWWADGAAAALAGLDVDVILATLSPFEGAGAAARAAARLGKPWVADLRDPWALDEMFVYPRPAPPPRGAAHDGARPGERDGNRDEHARRAARRSRNVPGTRAQADGSDPERLRSRGLRGTPDGPLRRGVPARAHGLPAHRARPRRASRPASGTGSAARSTTSRSARARRSSCSRRSTVSGRRSRRSASGSSSTWPA